MTLAETLQQKLVDWRPGEGRQLLTVPDDGAGWSLTLTTDRFDTVGCLAWELTLQRSNAAAPTAASLEAWADRVARRTTGLLEPLKVHEVDRMRNEALLRSQEPATVRETLAYYEVLLRGSGSAQVRRYQASRQTDTRREQRTFALTHDALVKLVSDITSDR